MSNQTNQPVEKIILGNVQVAIWKNTNANGRPYYSVSPQISYRDSNGHWKPGGSYSRDESLVLIEALGLAYHKVHELQKVDRNLERASGLANKYAEGRLPEATAA